jgi:hypothetical protein
VFIDTSGPEFIGWDDINGIDEVKQEIEEIIDYLKNPGEGSSCYFSLSYNMSQLCVTASGPSNYFANLHNVV